jgi:hypothetical protein
MTCYRSGPCLIAKLSPAVRDMIRGSQPLHSIRGDAMRGTTVSEVLGMIASFFYGTLV